MNINGVELYEPGDMVCQHFHREGKFEPAVMKEWLARLDQDKKAIDVGAYSGLYAIAAALQGVEADAWEPNPVLCSRIRANAERNGVTVTVKPYGAGSRSRSAFLVTRFPTSSAGHLVNRLDFGKTAQRVDVYQVKSDRPVSVVKIDVEGAEVDVLEGMEDLVTRDRPVVIAEANNDQAASALATWFNGRKYAYQWLDSRNMVFRPCE